MTTVVLGIAVFFQALEIVICIVLSSFYAWQYYHDGCQWEILYVSLVNLVLYTVAVTAGQDLLVTTAITDQTIPWMRYLGWLSTCPVILLHICNLTRRAEISLEETMTILVFNQLMILFGISAAIYPGAAKVALYSVAMCCGIGLYIMVYYRFLVFIEESKGQVRSLIYTIMVLFFSSWSIFPVAFIMGPTGLKLYDYEIDVCIHAFADVLSKNVFGILGYILVYHLLPKDDEDIDDADQGYRIDLESSQHSDEMSASSVAASSGEIVPRRLQSEVSNVTSPPLPSRRGSFLVSSSSRRRRRSSVPKDTISPRQGEQAQRQDHHQQERNILQPTLQLQRRQQQQPQPLTQQTQTMQLGAVLGGGIIGHRDQDGPRDAAANGESPPTKLPAHKHIVIIEDVPLMLMWWRKQFEENTALKDKDWTLHFCANGEEAFAILDTVAVDTIIVDGDLDCSASINAEVRGMEAGAVVEYKYKKIPHIYEATVKDERTLVHKCMTAQQFSLAVRMWEDTADNGGEATIKIISTSSMYSDAEYINSALQSGHQVIMEKPVPAMAKLSELIEMPSTLRQQGLFSCTVLGLHCIKQHLENHHRDDMLKTIANLVAVLKAIRCSVTLTTALQHLHESVQARAGAGSVNLALEHFESALTRELHHEALYIAEPRRRASSPRSPRSRPSSPAGSMRSILRGGGHNMAVQRGRQGAGGILLPSPRLPVAELAAQSSSQEVGTQGSAQSTGRMLSQQGAWQRVSGSS